MLNVGNQGAKATKTGTWVKEVIWQQHLAWASAEAHASGLPKEGQVLFVGSGTSYYLAQVAAEFGRRRGYHAEARPSEDVVLEPELALDGVATVVVISRSGTTSEAVWTMEVAREFGVRAVAVTCHGDSLLAQMADHALVSPEGEDDTVVMIRSFSSMLVLLQHSLADTELTDLAPYALNVLEQADQAISRLPAWPRRIYLLGAGVRAGITQEGALKAQEMSGISASAYSPLEFRHGPRGSVMPEDLVVLLGQIARVGYEWDVLEDLAKQGATMWAIAAPGWLEHGRSRGLAVDSIALPDAVPDMESGPLAVLPLQWLAWNLAVARDRDPDQPQNLSPVVSITRA